MDKKTLRLDIKNRLLKILENERIEKSKQACQRLISLPEFQKASTIMTYISFQQEVQTSEIILHAWQMEKIVAVPKVFWEDNHMLPVVLDTLDTDLDWDLKSLNSSEHTEPIPLEEIDLIITPGLAFDRAGNRLGRGKSFYDRFFKHEGLHAIRCGLAFEEQIVNEVPVNTNDVPMNIIVTNQEIIYV